MDPPHSDKGYLVFGTLETIGTTHDKERGRVDWGVTSDQTVIFHTTWPNVPYLTVSGLHIVNVSAVGFRLDRKPDRPTYWVAQEHPVVRFDMDDVRRILRTESDGRKVEVGGNSRDHMPQRSRAGF